LNETDIDRGWAPPPEWDHAVVCCWEQAVSRDRVQRVVPDGHADMLMYQQVVRLQRFVQSADAGVPLAAAAAAAGYADQSHLTRDVRRFSGLTPAPLMQERRST
jgi:AraC-like DNA-binding protein